MSTVEQIRFGARTAAFAATSGAFLSSLIVQRAVVAEANKHDLAHIWMRRWARAILRLFALDVLASGRYLGDGERYPPRSDDGVGRMFIFNHRSGMDIPVAYKLVDAHFVSRHDLEKWPLVGQAARAIGTLFVDRTSKRSGAGVLREMVTTLEGGCAVGMFPEGTTHRGDEVRPLRAGAFRAAAAPNAEIVPLGIAYDNDDAAFGKESFATHMQRISAMEGLRVSVSAGTPFRPDGRDLPTLRALGRERLQAAVNEARRRL